MASTGLASRLQAVEHPSWPTAACQRRSRSAHVLQTQRAIVARAAAARRLAGSSGGGGPAASGARRRAQLAVAANSSSSSSSSATADSSVAYSLAELRYTSPNGRWRVRPLNKADPAEVRRVVALQSDAFHSPAPLAALNGVTRRFFEAEVLSEMQKKLKFNPDELFASLVIEPTDKNAISGSGSRVIGGVEVSYVGQKNILRRLEPGTEGYCYIASMVVAPTWRRRGAAGALLAAAEAAVGKWDERQALLHVYQDNEAAVQLYRRQGYEVLAEEKGGLATLGRRPRYLMRKQW